MEISWKLHAGNLLTETMCWEIRVDAGGFLMGLTMAQCYGITLQFEAMVPGAELSIPAAQTFLERSEAKALLEAREVIRRVIRGMGRQR